MELEKEAKRQKNGYKYNKQNQSSKLIVWNSSQPCRDYARGATLNLLGGKGTTNSLKSEVALFRGSLDEIEVFWAGFTWGHIKHALPSDLELQVATCSISFFVWTQPVRVHNGAAVHVRQWTTRAFVLWHIGSLHIPPQCCECNISLIYLAASRAFCRWDEWPWAIGTLGRRAKSDKSDADLGRRGTTTGIERSRGHATWEQIKHPRPVATESHIVTWDNSVFVWSQPATRQWEIAVQVRQWSNRTFVRAQRGSRQAPLQELECLINFI